MTDAKWLEKYNAVVRERDYWKDTAFRAQDVLTNVNAAADVLREVVVDHLKNEDERLAQTKAFAAKEITQQAWMDLGDVTDRRRKAIEANMRTLSKEPRHG